MPAQFLSKLPSAHLKGNGMDQAFSEAATGLPVEERVHHKDAQLEPSISSESSDEVLAVVVTMTKSQRPSKTPTYRQSAALLRRLCTIEMCKTSQVQIQPVAAKKNIKRHIHYSQES